jgi:hypothetical protein
MEGYWKNLNRFAVGGNRLRLVIAEIGLPFHHARKRYFGDGIWVVDSCQEKTLL